MSRDATAWSVKGVDQATRDIARRAAAAAGMTIGEWIDQAIKSDSANRGIAVPADSTAERPAPRPDGISADTVEAIFSRIADGERLFEARLRPIGYALKEVAERVVALEREADRLPPPETPRLAAEPVPPATPAPTPIPFRPVSQPEIPVDDGPLRFEDDASAAVSEEEIWDSEPESEPAEPPVERPKPTPIVFRPIARPVEQPVEEKEEIEPVQREEPKKPEFPDGPPAHWKPEFDIDAPALAFAADDLRAKTRQAPESEPESVEETDDDLPEDLPAAPNAEIVTIPQRPDPEPPGHDFPADPIDTRSLGLTRERLPELRPARRSVSGKRIAMAAAIVLLLAAAATWSFYRHGPLRHGAVGDKLAEIEHEVGDAVSGAHQSARAWVSARVASSPERAPDAGTRENESPVTDPQRPPETVAAAPANISPEQPPVTGDTGLPGPAPSVETAPPTETVTPEETPTPGTSAALQPQQSAPSQSASPIGAPPVSAPPLPQTSVAVDPRRVSPPPAPVISEPPRRASPAAAPNQPATGSLSRAEAGNPAAQFEVAAGMMRAADARPAEAATWFREAAINGLDVAQFNLGVMYERGLGVPEDETRALLWYHSAAEQGHPLAQYNLGRLYALGKGIPQSDAEAKRWFQRAADRGVAAALYELARFEPNELERERKMYTAAKAGAEGAQDWLRQKSSGAVPEAPMGPAAGLVLDPPSGAPDVAAIQEGLSSLGYYDGPIDGIAGPMTRAAIGRFQSDNGLPATGLPSRSLRQRLN